MRDLFRRLYLAVARWYDVDEASRRERETRRLAIRARVRAREITDSVAQRYARQDPVWRRR